MTAYGKSVALLLAHLALVGSIAGKYAWERHTCPRVWTRATQYDPEQPLRGRYIALTLHADACGLPPGAEAQQFGWNTRHEWSAQKAQRWDVQPVARNGQLAVRSVNTNEASREPLTLARTMPCTQGVLSDETEFFIAEHAELPFPLKKDQELWAEVTVPPSGPPRPIRLAVSDGRNFRVLDLR